MKSGEYRVKKYLKYILICTVFLCLSVVLTGCDLFSGDNNEPDVPAPTEIDVTGFSPEITVGDPIYTKLTVYQKINGEWEDVPKADFIITCDYDATRYGTYELVVSLREYPDIKYTAQITVKPIYVTVPSYSTTYTGEEIDIKSCLESQAQVGGEKAFEVTAYEKKTDVGEYTAKVRLLNADKYVWFDGENVLSTRTQNVSWTITKAGKIERYDKTEVSAFYGDTLLDVIGQNELNYVNGEKIDFQFIDDVGNELSHSTIITNQTVLYAKFRPNKNYEYNDLVTLNVSIVANAGYTVEHYKFDGESYQLADSEQFSGKITSVVTATAKQYDGFLLNEITSIKVGRVTKDGSLILKLYYDAE